MSTHCPINTGVPLFSDGWHRRWPGQPAKTLLHATVRQKGFRFAPALAGLKSPFFWSSHTDAAFRSIDGGGVPFSYGAHQSEG